MEKPRAVILVLFALVLVFNSDPLMAQTADPGATTNQKLANEIVALRKRVEQLEKQNAELRGTIRDTKNKRSVEPTNMNGAVATADANVYAADLPRKAAPFVPAQVSDWSGVYMGIEGGYGWGKQSTDAIDPGAPFSAAFTSPSLHPGEVASLIPPTSFPDLAIPSTKQNGWLLGGFFGAQKQWGSWVLGIEGDIDGANIRGSGSSTASLTLQTLTFGPFPASPSVTFTCPGPCATLNHDLAWPHQVGQQCSAGQLALVSIGSSGTTRARPGCSASNICIMAFPSRRSRSAITPEGASPSVRASISTPSRLA
jgi:opacity protein-like surface antigen